jgi:hypothetical protein
MLQTQTGHCEARPSDSKTATPGGLGHLTLSQCETYAQLPVALGKLYFKFTIHHVRTSFLDSLGNRIWDLGSVPVGPFPAQGLAMHIQAMTWLLLIHGERTRTLPTGALGPQSSIANQECLQNRKLGFKVVISKY